MKTLAWIIGGTSGIGLETAHRLKNHVDEVVVLGRSDGAHRLGPETPRRRGRRSRRSICTTGSR